MIDVQVFLIQNRQKFIDHVMKAMDTTHTDKCIRDFTLMYNAVVEDISNNSSSAIARNASHFWHRGKLQILNVCFLH